MGYILIPVYNNDEKVDLLTGLVANQRYGYYEKRNYQNFRSREFGEAVSEFTGEVFRVQEVSLKEKVKRIGTFHMHLLGSKGTHYVGTFTFDNTGELTFIRVSVPESSGYKD